jgi:hypothetical protein
MAVRKVSVVRLRPFLWFIVGPEKMACLFPVIQPTPDKSNYFSFLRRVRQTPILILDNVSECMNRANENAVSAFHCAL